MSNHAFRTALKYGVAVLVITGAATQAFAQSTEPPAGKPATEASSATAAAGPGGAAKAKVRMPLADPSQFLDSASSANTPALEKALVPGVSGTAANASNLDSPAAFGTSKAPYSTRRVAVQALGTSTLANATPVTSYPFRATGRLWMKFSDGWYICTASMISKNIVLTAAHCVHNYGQKAAGYASEVWYYPAQYTGSNGAQATPYGTFKATKWRVLSPYYNGTDTCTQTGVVCNNDVATVVLAKNSAGKYAGDVTGWYNYGWNGYSYTGFFGSTVVQLHQLGYPAALDSGMDMERTDGAGWYYASGYLKNTQLGSAQTGGSSGGPWLVNLGRSPTVTDTTRANLGSSTTQAVVGVTSYGATAVGYNRQGASFFGQNKEYPNSWYGPTNRNYGAGNIGALVYSTVASDGGIAP